MACDPLPRWERGRERVTVKPRGEVLPCAQVDARRLAGQTPSPFSTSVRLSSTASASSSISSAVMTSGGARGRM